MPTDNEQVQVISTNESHFEERRIQSERRTAGPLMALKYWLLGGHRQQGRRADSMTPSYVDTYQWPLLLMALGVVALNCLDAFFTLTLISRGAIEVNPVMDYLINRDIQMFVNVKLGMTALCIIVLVMHSPFRLLGTVPVSRILATIFVMYGVLVGYELMLLRLSA